MNVISRSLEVPALSSHRPQMLAGSALVAAALIVLRAADPASSGLFPPCPFFLLTGFYCPGCGSLRALHQLLEGHLLAAVAFNPFAVLSIPFLAYGGASHASFLLRGRYLPRSFVPGWLIWTLFFAVILFAIARNIPAYPFELLAPGAMLLGN